MVRALRVFWLALKDLFDEFALLLMVNLIWSLISLPLVLLSWVLLRGGLWLEGLLLSVVAVLPLAPASVALCAVADQVSAGIVSSWRTYWSALRMFALASWKALGLWQLGFLLILLDIWFYSGIGSLLGVTLTIFWLYMLLIWLALLIYLLPLLIIQKGIGLLDLGRTAAVLTFGRPLFSLTLLVMLVLVVLISLIIPPLLVLLSISLLALVGVRATHAALAESIRKHADPASPAPESAERGRRGQVRPRE